MAERTAISPTREQNYPEWYQQVVKAADLAEASPVRGCMVIKPWGFTLWENMERELDRRFKATGVENAYFPLFIPLSFLEREAEHVEGFAKECAVVTHSRLKAGPDGKLIPAPESELEEPLIVRPTSETIIGEMFAKWVQSYRDLPLLINQWANVVRWELRTRMFLRTAEFLWQEGHTVHATSEDARVRTRQMLEVYADFAESYMAMPVITGEKTASERFPGADATYSIESMMQDRKALQAGTSHFLGQNFAKASGIKYLSEGGQEEFAWTTSWGVSTRLVGGLIMTHGDDDGLQIPPKLAPTQVVIIPVIHKDEVRAQVMEACEKLKAELEAQSWDGVPLRVHLDGRDLRAGEKMWGWIKKGAPVWVELGPKDIEKGTVFAGRRDQGPKQRQGIPQSEFVATIGETLAEIQSGLLERAKGYRAEHTHRIDSKDDFYAFFTPKKAGDERELHGGFALTHWNGSAAVEEQIKSDLRVTIRCVPFADEDGPGTCPFTGEPSPQRVVWAKAY